jgi:NADPH:quinone reductase-like Zn-dependent oxidoreductase
MSLLGGGGQAELAVVHDRVAMPVPDSVDLHVAGGFAEAYTTAHDALFTQCGLGCGERVLVHGATGGVGSAAVQLAVAAGAQVTACLRATEHAAAIAAMGAQVVEPSGFVDAGPFDVVLETVGAASIPRDIDALAVGGRLAVIGTRATGTRAEIDFRQLMAKRARIFASTLRSRPLEERARAARLVERHALPLLAAGRLTVPVHAFRPLTGAPDAYAAFDRPGKLGKIILTVRPDREGVDDE